MPETESITGISGLDPPKIWWQSEQYRHCLEETPMINYDGA